MEQTFGRHPEIDAHLFAKPYRDPRAIAHALLARGRPFSHRRSGVRLGQLKLYLTNGQPRAVGLHVGRNIMHVLTDPGVYDRAHRMIC